MRLVVSLVDRVVLSSICSACEFKKSVVGLYCGCYRVSLYSRLDLYCEIVVQSRCVAVKPPWMSEEYRKYKPPITIELPHKNTYNQSIASVKRLPITCPPSV